MILVFFKNNGEVILKQIEKFSYGKFFEIKEDLLIILEIASLISSFIILYIEVKEWDILINLKNID